MKPPRRSGLALLACAFVSAGPLVAVLCADVGTWTEFSGEVIRAADITLARGTAAARLVRGNTEVSFSAAQGAIAFDYQPAPFDFRGQALTCREASTALRTGGQHRFAGGPATALFALGGYRGFTSYRSAWLNEYYRQQYSSLSGTPGLDAFRPAAPAGRDASFGGRWEYIKGNAFAQLTAGYAQDRVAPGYEIDFAGLRRSPDTLATTSAALAFENVLSPRVRSRAEVRVADTSGRELRVGGEAEARAALGEAWIARAQIGGAREQPAFSARFAGLAIERELGRSVSVYAEGRLYRDTGEIENALLFTSAAPALRSQSVGVGLRHDGDRWSWRIVVARLHTDFAPTNLNTDFFRQLYRDRDWLTLQAALSARF